MITQEEAQIYKQFYKDCIKSFNENKRADFVNSFSKTLREVNDKLDSLKDSHKYDSDSECGYY